MQLNPSWHWPWSPSQSACPVLQWHSAPSDPVGPRDAAIPLVGSIAHAISATAAMTEETTVLRMAVDIGRSLARVWRAMVGYLSVRTNPRRRCTVLQRSCPGLTGTDPPEIAGLRARAHPNA